MSDFIFGNRSRNNLLGVHTDLVAVATRALSLSVVDFGIVEGLRSVSRQAEMVSTGKSRTMNSKHLLGHAVDVAAWVDGEWSWELPYYQQIALAFRQASIEFGVQVRWGRIWDRQLGTLDVDLTFEIKNYEARFRAAHPDPIAVIDGVPHYRRPLADGPHFELRMDPGLTAPTLAGVSAGG